MTRDEVLKFGLDFARDEYARAQGRLALIETKAQLVGATAGLFATLLVTLGTEHLPLHDAGDGMLCVAVLLSLAVALFLSLSASLLVHVRPPPSAQVTAGRCLELIGETGDTTRVVDQGAAELLVGNTSDAYLVAAAGVVSVLKDRASRLLAAQVALLVALLLTAVWLGLPLLGSAIALINKGG